MSRIVIPPRTRLVYVESRGWLLGKLGVKVLVIAGVIFVWGPLVAGRPNAMRLVGWLVWAAITLLAVGAVIRIVEAIWGAGCTVLRARPFVGGGRGVVGLSYRARRPIVRAGVCPMLGDTAEVGEE